MVNILNSLYTDAFYSKFMPKLKDSDIIVIKDFINVNENLDNDAFEMKINRMFMGKEKPKNWTFIIEVLSIINTRRGMILSIQS